MRVHQGQTSLLHIPTELSVRSSRHAGMLFVHWCISPIVSYKFQETGIHVLAPPGIGWHMVNTEQ